MEEGRILGGLNTSVQNGYHRVVKISSDGSFIYELTEKGIKRLNEMIADHFNLTVEEFLQCPPSVRKLLHDTLCLDMAEDQELASNEEND